MIDYVYVEKDASAYSACGRILAGFGGANIIPIENYKDVFCRANQNYRLQKSKPALILAVNRSGFIYRGADNCQNFGNDSFYYCSLSKNCLFSCDYCYLQGMYRSGNIVVFVNIEDCFRETEALLCEKGKVYMCLSYDSDIFAMEKTLKYVKEWNEFARKHVEQDFSAEVRTKSASTVFFKENEPCDGMIFAWTLSPEAVVKALEKRTAPASKRLEAAVYAAKHGFRVRLCLDPVTDLGDGKMRGHYAELASMIESSGIAPFLDSVSVGPFRVPSEYVKLFRHNAPDSAVSWYDYTVKNGTASYSPELVSEINGYVAELLIKAGIPSEKIYGWEGKR